MVTVRRGGLGWLNPEAIFWVSGRSAVVVEWSLRKPCWVGEIGKLFSSGSRRRSRTLAAGQSSEIGR